MTVQIWIDQLQLDQLYNNIANVIENSENTFDNLVEYTPVPVLSGQICVNLNYDTYVMLTDNELLVEWQSDQI